MNSETRKRVLCAARECFGEQGYDKTTNKDIANRAGITTGAIYHYFESKQELFLAVFDDTSEVIFDELERALLVSESFVGRSRALLDLAVKLHAGDQSLAKFTAVLSVELQRDSALADSLLLRRGGRDLSLNQRIVRDAMARGEIAPDITEQAVVDMLDAITSGLAQFGAAIASTDRHRAMVDAVGRLVDGSLVTRSDGIRTAG